MSSSLFISYLFIFDPVYSPCVICGTRVTLGTRSKWDKFSLDMLITLAARSGKKVELAMA